jgi:hypothetical protein
LRIIIRKQLHLLKQQRSVLQEGVLQTFITESNFTSIAWLSGTPVIPSGRSSSSRLGKARSFHGVVFWKASSASAIGTRDKKANE